MQEWQALHTPPIAGGLDDQPAGLRRRGRYLMAVAAVFDNFYNGDGSALRDGGNRKLFQETLAIGKDLKRHERDR